jgi:monoamine oxidase
MARTFYGKLYRRYGAEALSGKQQLEATDWKRGRFNEFLPSSLKKFPGGLVPLKRLPFKGQVVVVGAGFAGLLAAWCLKKRGVPVVVLEASDRIGGRVQSLGEFTPGQLIEGGAELIGSNHPAWLLLARHFGLGLSVITPEDDFEGAGLEMPFFLKGRGVVRAAGRILDPPVAE